MGKDGGLFIPSDRGGGWLILLLDKRLYKPHDLDRGLDVDLYGRVTIAPVTQCLHQDFERVHSKHCHLHSAKFRILKDAYQVRVLPPG